MDERATAMATMGRVAAAASQATNAHDRAADVLEELRAIIPFEAAHFSMVDPVSGNTEVIVNEGYDQRLLDHLNGDYFRSELASLNMIDSGKPLRMQDVPGDPRDVRTIEEVLLPAGYAEGLTMCLRTPDGRFTGLLNLSTSSTDQPSDIAREAISSLCGVLALMTDPLQQGKWLSTLVGASTIGVGLDAAGRPVPIPGVTGHELLEPDSLLVRVAGRTAQSQAWGSFIWEQAEQYYKVRVLPFTAETQALSAVVTLSDTTLDPLSARELEVLTLATEGLSNVEIGDALCISRRTVSTHVEHILEKLGTPTRAAAAVKAISEGLVLGHVRRIAQH